MVHTTPHLDINPQFSANKPDASLISTIPSDAFGCKYLLSFMPDRPVRKVLRRIFDSSDQRRILQGQAFAQSSKNQT
jgi:hypothetical protein